MPIDFDDEDRLPPEQFDLPLLSIGGRLAVADFSAAGPHRFGGSLALDIRGGPAGAAERLHRLLTLSLGDPALNQPIAGLAELPLVYGFLFDGCRLRYRVIDARRIELLELSPSKPTKDWPYPRYPASFPEKRFALRSHSQAEPDRVSELAWQGIEHPDPAQVLVAIVPPNDIYGVSLWGEHGDPEGVQVVFEIDPATATVTAYNQCT